MLTVTQSKSMKHLLALTAVVASALTGAGVDGGSTQFSFTGEEEGNRIFLGSYPTVSGDGSLFAFEWNDRIWTASTTGGVAKCVTPGQWKCANPALASDGRRIAFTSNREGDGNHVFEYDATDGSVRQISFHSEMTQPCAWTPDGADLLVSVWRDHAVRHGARLARLSTKERRDIDVLFDAESFDPALSPDGKTLLFRRRGDNVYRKRIRSKESRKPARSGPSTGRRGRSRLSSRDASTRASRPGLRTGRASTISTPRAACATSTTVRWTRRARACG